MSSIFFTADLHFNHDKILKYCNRPFKTIEEMNAKLIENWNIKVPKGGLVYVLGDLGWRHYDHLLDQLNGQIILVKGSHDYESDLRHKKIVKIERLINKTIEGQRVTMCHYNMRVWHLSHYNSWHLYGHSHGRLQPAGEPHMPGLGKAWDVGVDRNNYTPLSWEMITEIMWSMPDNFNLKEELKCQKPADSSTQKGETKT